MSNYTDDDRGEQPDSLVSLQPLHLLLMIFARWINRHQLDVVNSALSNIIVEDIGLLAKQRKL
jgi:hypothetical protein